MVLPHKDWKSDISWLSILVVYLSLSSIPLKLNLSPGKKFPFTSYPVNAVPAVTAYLKYADAPLDLPSIRVGTDRFTLVLTVKSV